MITVYKDAVHAQGWLENHSKDGRVYMGTLNINSELELLKPQPHFVPKKNDIVTRH